jgi:RND family efflux transporter MFP subunit
MRRLFQILFPLVVLGMGAGGAAWLIANKKRVKPEITERLKPIIEVETVTFKKYRPIIISQGTAQPRTTIGLSPEVSGRVTSVSSKLVAGGLFEEGDELFRVDGRDYELTRQRALADINSAQAQTTNALAQISSAAALKAQAEARITREEAEAKAAHAEWALLGKSGEPSDLLARVPQIKEAKAGLFSANAHAKAAAAQLHSTGARLKAAQAALEQASLNVERCVVRAPFHGRVQSQSIGVGQIVSRASVLARLQPVDTAEVRLSLPLEQFRFLDLSNAFQGGKNAPDGPVVRLRPSYKGAVEWAGRVVRSVGEVDRGTRMMAVVAEVVDPYRQESNSTVAVLSFGMFMRAEIDGRVLNNVAVLPRGVLRGGDAVHVYENGQLKAREVTVAWSTREVVVISGGLREGERVCLTRVDAFLEGMSVAVKGVGADE